MKNTAFDRKPQEDSGSKSSYSSESFYKTYWRQHRLLIVDDEPDILDELSAYLSHKGFLCETAADGREAMKKANDIEDIAIILTDIRMPGLDGLDLARNLLESASKAERDIEVIMLTGHAGIDEAIEALQVGASDFLTKPISLDDLMETVRQADHAIRMRRLNHHYRRAEGELLNKRTAEVEHLAAECEMLKQCILVQQSGNENSGAAAKPRNKPRKLSGMNALIGEIYLPGLELELIPAAETVIGMVDVLRQDKSLNEVEGVGLCLGHLWQAATEIQGFAHNCADLMAATCGYMEFTKVDVFMNDTFDRIIARGAVGAEAIGGELTSSIQGKLPGIQSDPVRLEQALSLVFDCATSLAPIGGNIYLRAEGFSDKIRIGIGFLGEPVQQVDGVEELPHLSDDRLGIGYSLACQMVHILGGTIKLDNGPGNGLGFSVDLPL
jgi:CheY-like chemotaxis protein